MPNYSKLKQKKLAKFFLKKVCLNFATEVIKTTHLKMEHWLTSYVSIAQHWRSKVGHENIDIPRGISSENAKLN